MAAAVGAADPGDAFALPTALLRHRSEGVDAVYLPQFLAPSEAGALFTELRARMRWQQEHVTLFGRRVAVPRWVAWAGDPDVCYRYSGVDHRCEGWSSALARLHARVHTCLGRRFNFALANLYRDGRDHMGWHADAELALGERPLIASVSLGATRRFVMRRRDGGRRVSFDLADGSLLLMFGTSQVDWRHALPRAARARGERINVTFRRVRAASATGRSRDAAYE